jgi:hypothetical protein
MGTIAEQYEAFAELARKYCEAVEDTSVEGEQGLRLIHDLLFPLHTAAMQLPEVECEGETRRAIGQDAWHNAYKGLQERLPCDLYWDTFDPLTETPNEVVAGSIADDLADIWRDLKSGLLELDANDTVSKMDVWWGWRFNFHFHWGAHSASALRVLYYALRDS